jgi:hypothetical protein
VHGAHAALLQPALDAQVEVGRVDADEHVRLPFQRTLAERRAQLQQAWQVAQHFGQAHHRQLAGIVPGLAAGAAHGIAADAGEFGIREARLQLAHQARTEQVAGGFTGHQRDPQRALAEHPLRRNAAGHRGQRNHGGAGRRLAGRAAHRSKGLSACSMKSSMAFTSSLSRACSVSCTLASASGRPATYSVR